MKTHFLILMVLAVATQLPLYGQQKTTNKDEITKVINTYARSVVEKDSAAFYDLFNNGPVVWAGAVKDRSQAKLVKESGPATNYFTGSYKSFLRSLFKMKTSEDKFDNIRILEDGTAASVVMDYSFWKDGKMTNWGSKQLGLLKIDGRWKITSVIYSVELTDYFPQPPVAERAKAR